MAPEPHPTGTGTPLSLSATGSDCSYPDSVDGAGQAVSYGPEKAVDAEADTAWRCPGAAGHTLQLRPEGPARVTDLGLIPGYAKTDPSTGVDRFPDNHTVTQVVWRLYDGRTWYELVQDIPAPSAEITWVHLSRPVDVQRATLTVTSTGNPGSRMDTTPVSTVAMWGSA